MADKTNEILSKIRNALIEGPLSINEIADKAEITWRTAEHNLTVLKNLGLVEELEVKNTRTFIYKDKNNYFSLPIKGEDKEKIDSIYAKIREHCLKIYNKEPTKTHVYKILWKINKTLKLNLPIGWYMYGPCCIQIYTGEEKGKKKLNHETISMIEETTEEYCKFDNITLQRMIYEEEKDLLYQLKEKLTASEKKEERDLILMEIIRFTPNEAIETITDFVRATLMLGWDQTKQIFDKVWKYIALIKFKETLSDYYGKNINLYLNHQIGDIQKEAHLFIMDLVTTHTDSKYSQDNLYQRWVKQKR